MKREKVSPVRTTSTQILKSDLSSSVPWSLGKDTGWHKENQISKFYNRTI